MRVSSRCGEEAAKKRVFKQQWAAEKVFCRFCDVENWDGDVGTAQVELRCRDVSCMAATLSIICVVAMLL